MSIQADTDKGLKHLFQSLDKANAPFGLDDRIMKAVETEHRQQHSVRRNLRLALAGVAASFILICMLAFGTETIVNGALQVLSLEDKGFSSLIIIFLFFIGMLFLFLEMELVVKYWLHKHFAHKER